MNIPARIASILIAASLLSSCTAAILYAAARPEIKARREAERAARSESGLSRREWRAREKRLNDERAARWEEFWAKPRPEVDPKPASK